MFLLSCSDWISGGFLCEGNSGLMGKDALNAPGQSMVLIVLLISAW